jgi:hypothetical protein
VAVWRHGFVNRVTQHVDIVLPADRIEEFLRTASVSGFQVLSHAPGRWPKVHHKETGVDVDVLPEGQRPGVANELAPTTIPPPKALGAEGPTLRYINLSGLVELKIAAGRLKDKADVVELIRANADQTESLRQHLSGVEATYMEEFDSLVQEARRDSEPG